MTNYQKDQVVIAEDIFQRTIAEALKTFLKHNAIMDFSDSDIFRQAYVMGVGAGVMGLMRLAEANAGLSEEDEGGECADKPDGISEETWEIMKAKMERAL